MESFDLFKHKTPEPKFKGRVFDYHEDDFCQVELLPKENMTEIGKDLQAIGETRQKHSSPNGFTKTHLLQDKKVKTVNRNIALTEIDAILTGSSFAKFDTVTTGYGSIRYDSEYSSAFGEKGCAIIYERNSGKVDRIWLDYYPAWADDNMRSEMSKCLTKICSKWDLVLVDWRQDVVVDPTNNLSLSSYLIGKNDE